MINTEAPAHDAAEAWLKTQVGKITVSALMRSDDNQAMAGMLIQRLLARTFVSGYLIGEKAAEAAGEQT